MTLGPRLRVPYLYPKNYKWNKIHAFDQKDENIAPNRKSGLLKSFYCIEIIDKFKLIGLFPK